MNLAILWVYRGPGQFPCFAIARCLLIAQALLYCCTWRNPRAYLIGWQITEPLIKIASLAACLEVVSAHFPHRREENIQWFRRWFAVVGAAVGTVAFLAPAQEAARVTPFRVLFAGGLMVSIIGAISILLVLVWARATHLEASTRVKSHARLVLYLSLIHIASIAAINWRIWDAGQSSRFEFAYADGLLALTAIGYFRLGSRERIEESDLERRLKRPGQRVKQ